jgi:hypothetical protein
MSVTINAGFNRRLDRAKGRKALYEWKNACHLYFECEWEELTPRTIALHPAAPPAAAGWSLQGWCLTTDADTKRRDAADTGQGVYVHRPPDNVLKRKELEETGRIQNSEDDNDGTDYSLKEGDLVYSRAWGMNAVVIVNVNWALSAAAVRLYSITGKPGDVIVWPVQCLSRQDIREDPDPKSNVAEVKRQILLNDVWTRP